ncbi:hypothetical protein BDN70DRAFT_977219 [Pholiota conissans]|uniref:Response regulatory domain-containing protein n=1 Tax=Pholiota conissans TaxID=109636 RepID=A0A9P6D246_9AGAR|nr:hypothetical protein BDN70DRAFT_977219 [Pholiota conissans]
MPLPSQLSQLQNPHKSLQHTAYLLSPLPSPQVREVSMELADSIQLAIQTMLQISPPQVLDPAREQFSACSLSVPTSSMSALFTAMKSLNYLSANMTAFCESATDPHPKSHNEFDIGEVLQCVGDALSGAAAQCGVDLVIYHGDVGLKHVYVSGDESGISFALSHIIRQVLSTAERGDSIELGLLVNPIAVPTEGLSPNKETPPIDDLLTAVPLLSNGPVKVTIRISHKYSPSETHQGVSHPKDVVTTEIRPRPSFNTLFLRRILRQIDGNLIEDLPPPEAFTSGRTCDLEMVLDRVPLPPAAPPAEHANDGALNEPSLEQLSSFGETLKGKRVTLYASARGSFAHHLTSYLTAWGMDVTHVSPDGQVDGLGEQSPQEDCGPASYNQPLKPEQRISPLEGPSFIVVDDDVDILKERLQVLRYENQPSLSGPSSRKRPPISARSRSTSQVARFLGLNNLARPSVPVVILHFTSLANYKLVRDIMQSITLSYNVTSTPLPEVMIIPKPAGPRRFLTALHTAVTKPNVDPMFSPIATSPISPGIRESDGSFFSTTVNEMQTPGSPTGGSHASGAQNQSPGMKSVHRPRGSRSSSDRSTRSAGEAGGSAFVAVPPSPLALPDNVEYFSAAAQKLGQSPSSGLVIQSPDGQTAGIYFHPKSKSTSRNPSTRSMERGNGQLMDAGGSPDGSRSTLQRTMSGRTKVERAKEREKEKETASLSVLHQASQPRPALNVNPAPSSSTSMSSGLVKSVGPPSLSKSILSPVPRRKSEDKQGLASASPAEGSTTPTRRAGSKRGSDAKEPVAAAAKKRGKTFGSDTNVVPPISVLIVDDNPINQTILSTFMKRKRIKYDLASNGQEAVQKWRTGGFHLILMDIQMPVMDGIQATKEIRRLEKSNATAGYPPPSPFTDGQRTPSSPSSSTASTSTSEAKYMNSPYRSSVIIVALTASSLQSDRVAALAAGCNDFLTKPVSLLWLNNKIIEWGSIKALQMWADIRPEAVTKMQSGQAEQATRVAERLQLPASATKAQGRRVSTSMLDDNAAALALASSAGPVPGLPSPIPSSPTVPYFKTPGWASPVARTNSPGYMNSPDALKKRETFGVPFKKGSLDSEDGVFIAYVFAECR